MTLAARVSLFSMFALLIAAIISGCNGGSGNSNTTHVPWTGTSSGWVQTTTATGGTGGSTGGSGGSTMTTTVTGGTGGMTASTSNTGGTGGSTTVPIQCDPDNTNCFCTVYDPPIDDPCNETIPSACTQYFTTDYPWMNDTAVIQGTIKIVPCGNAIRVNFDMLDVDTTAHPTPDFHGLRSCGQMMYFRKGDPDHRYCEAFIDASCIVSLYCYDRNPYTEYYSAMLSPL